MSKAEPQKIRERNFRMNSELFEVFVAGWIKKVLQLNQKLYWRLSGCLFTKFLRRWVLCKKITTDAQISELG